MPKAVVSWFLVAVFHFSEQILSIILRSKQKCYKQQRGSLMKNKDNNQTVFLSQFVVSLHIGGVCADPAGSLKPHPKTEH